VTLHVAAQAAFVILETSRQRVEGVTNRNVRICVTFALVRLDDNLASGHCRLDPHAEQVALLAMSVGYLDHHVAVVHPLREAFEFLGAFPDLSLQSFRPLNVAKRDSERFHDAASCRPHANATRRWHGRCFGRGMGNEEIQNAYRRFVAMYANSHVVRSLADFRAAVLAAGLEKNVGDDWLRALDRRWVYGESAVPFPDDEANRRYRRLVEA
jgi:hypothetical protein